MEVVLDVDDLCLLVVNDVGKLWLLAGEVFHAESVLGDSSAGLSCQPLELFRGPDYDFRRELRRELLALLGSQDVTVHWSMFVVYT